MKGKSSGSSILAVILWLAVAALFVSTTSGMDLEVCLSDWRTADVNDSGALERDEYIGFINALRARKCAVTPQATLTLQQNAAFTSLACQCAWDHDVEHNNRDDKNGTTDCCLGVRAKLPTAPLDPTARTETQTLFLTVVCTVTDQTIPDACAGTVEDGDTATPSDVDSGDAVVSGDAIITPQNEDTLDRNIDPLQRAPNNSSSSDDRVLDGWWWLIIVGATLVVLTCCCAIGSQRRQNNKSRNQPQKESSPPVRPIVASSQDEKDDPSNSSHERQAKQYSSSDEEEGMTVESAVHTDDTHDEEDGSIPIYGDGDPSETDHTQTTSASEQYRQQQQQQQQGIRIVGEANTNDNLPTLKTSISSSEHEIKVASYNSESTYRDDSHQSQEEGGDDCENDKEEEYEDDEDGQEIKIHEYSPDEEEEEEIGGKEAMGVNYKECSAIVETEPLVQSARNPNYSELSKNTSVPNKMKQSPSRRHSPPKSSDFGDTSSRTSFGLWEALRNDGETSINSSHANLNDAKTSTNATRKRKKTKKDRLRKPSAHKSEAADSATTSSQTSFGLWDVLDNQETSNGSSMENPNSSKEEEKTSEHSSPPTLSSDSLQPLVGSRHYSNRLDELSSVEMEKPPTPEKEDDPTEESVSSVQDESQPIQEDNASFSFDWIVKSLGK